MKLKVYIRQRPFEEAVARKGLSYKDFAKRLRISRIYLSNLKSEKSPDYRPSGELREKIMKILGVIFDEIFVMVWNDRERK